jgi:hypothetical protein
MTKDDYQIIPISDSGGGGMGFPAPQRSDRADLIDKIKPEQVVEVIRNRLLGKEFINGEWKDVVALNDFKLTEIGAWEISNLMLGIGNISTSISKLNGEAINRRLRNLTRSTQITLITNWRRYGIRNKAHFYHIHEIMFSHAWVVLNQAGDASIQELLKATIYENRNIQSAPKEKMSNKIARALGMGGN